MLRDHHMHVHMVPLSHHSLLGRDCVEVPILQSAEHTIREGPLAMDQATLPHCPLPDCQFYP